MKAYLRCGFGVVIAVVGLAWLASIRNAEHRSSRIQHGERVEAVVDDRRHTSTCFHFTCDQTVFTIRYIAGGRIWRSRVIADGWDHSHPPGDPSGSGLRPSGYVIRRDIRGSSRR